MKRFFTYTISISLLFCSFTLIGCRKKTHVKKATFKSWKEIKREGILRVAAEYNAFEFYTDGKDTLGYYYELVNAFGKAYNLSIQYYPIMSFTDRVDSLSKGKIDLIASSIPTTQSIQKKIRLSLPVLKSKQVLVQRKAEEKTDSTYIDNSLQLANETIYVIQNSPAKLRLHNLSNEIGDTIYIKEIKKYGPEQLMAMVSHKNIDYSICDEITARIHLDAMPNLDIKQKIGFTQYYAWGAHLKSPQLIDTLNYWLQKYQSTSAYKKLQRKYKIK